MKKAVIFDFDGTLADTEGFLRKIYGEIAREKKWKPLDRRKFRNLFTASIWDAGLWAKFMPWRVAHLVNQSRHRLKNEYKQIKIFTGMKQAIQKLDKSGYDIYVLSRNWQSTVQLVVDNNGLGKTVHVMEKPGFFSKHKSVKKLIAQKNYSRDNTWMVGDEVRDLYAAKRARVAFIGVTWGFQEGKTLRAFHPTAVVKSPEEIVKIILARS